MSEQTPKRQAPKRSKMPQRSTAQNQKSNAPMQTRTSMPKADRQRPHAGANPQNGNTQAARRPIAPVRRPGQDVPQKPARPQVQRPLKARNPGVSAVNKAASREEINRKIRSQTPASREEARRVKHVGGSVKNLEIKRRNDSKKQKFYIKKKREALGKLLLARLILFLITFILMFALVSGVFMLSLRMGASAKAVSYTLQLGEDIPEDMKGKAAKEDMPVYLDIPKGCAVRNDVLYIPISALSEMCELTVTGTSSDLRYIPRSSEGESVSFVVGTNIAHVNGAKIRMIAPCFKHGSELYIPLDFLKKYSTGLIITEDNEKDKITISRYVDRYDPETDSDIYSPLEFTLALSKPLVPVPEPEEPMEYAEEDSDY